MKDFWVEPEQKKVNKKKVIISITIAIVLIIFITITIIYANNKNVRNWIDKNIFQKEKTLDDSNVLINVKIIYLMQPDTLLESLSSHYLP